MWEEGGIVGGIMHISSNNLSRVRSTFNGTKSLTLTLYLTLTLTLTLTRHEEPGQRPHRERPSMWHDTSAFGSLEQSLPGLMA